MLLAGAGAPPSYEIFRRGQHVMCTYLRERRSHAPPGGTVSSGKNVARGAGPEKMGTIGTSSKETGREFFRAIQEKDYRFKPLQIAG